MICPIQLQQVNDFVDVKIPSPKEFYQRFGFRPQGGYLPNDLPFAESGSTIADCVQSQNYIEALQQRQNAGASDSE